MPRQFPPEFRARALRLVEARLEEEPSTSEYDAIRVVAPKLGIGTETLRRWRRRAEIDAGVRPGTTTAEHEEIRRLKRELAESRRTVEVLKAASAFFAAELDRPATK